MVEKESQKKNILDLKIFLDIIKGKELPPPYEESIPEEIRIAAEPDLSRPLPKKLPMAVDPQSQSIQTKQIAAGLGYHGGNLSGVSNVPCSRSIVDDISRLEVLIGGKRAGNNSPEIINEATEICKRLFQGRIMDIGMYRSFINELIDDYYSD